MDIQRNQRNEFIERNVRIKRRKKREKRQRRNRMMVICISLIIAGAVLLNIYRIMFKDRTYAGGEIEYTQSWPDKDYSDSKPEMQIELLTPNEYSRPQEPLEKVNGIVIHYTANPGSTAMNNRDYFEGLKDSHQTYVSSHFVVGIQGEIVQCVPTSEIAYASNERNSDTISIEVCHLDETGEFTKETYDSLVALTGWLCLYKNVSPGDIIRHYDVTGKICPKYYVEHEDAWYKFKADVEKWAVKHKG